MTGVNRDSQAIAKLVRVARLRAEELSGRIAMLQAAYTDAEDRLKRLDDSVRREEAAAFVDVSPAHFAGFMEGANQKRMALEQTKASLFREIEQARLDVEDAFAEMKKFEHLAERLSVVIADRRAKAELERIEEAALSRFRKSEAR
jgi:flagellar FliJ protein